MRKSIWKRALSLVLSLAMLLTLVPAFNVLPEAKAAEDRVIEDQTDANGNKVNYITLPITIRDFAADGMLFEWNEVDTDKGTETVVTETDGLTHTSYEVDYNPYYWDRNSTGTATGSTEGYKGIRVYSKDWPVYDEEYDNTETNGAWWYVLILNSKGDIIKVLDMESEKEDVDTVIAATTGAAYSVWAWADSSNAEASAPLKEIYADYAAALAKYNNDEEKAVAALAKHRFTLTGVTGSGNAITGTLSRGRYYKNESLKQVPKETHEDGYETNPYKTDARGVYLFDGNAVAGYLGDGTLSSLDAYNSAWHTVVMNSSNQVVAVVPKMPQGDDVDEDKYKKSLALANYVTSDYKILMVWDTDENADYRDLFTCITDETKSEYTITGTATSFDTSVLSVTRTRTFVEADTKAFGLLATNENDYLDVLDPDAETNAIFGSEFISQGGWNSSTEPEVLEAGLYSVDNRTTPYATQDVYGATIRTNLVDKGLDKNGNPLYTPETVTFLANYMEQIMAVPERNADGTYNSYFVTGVKLFDENWNYVGNKSPLAIHTLADMLRYTMDKYADDAIATYGNTIGTYADAKTKFESGGLQYAYQVRTWCEAAYYLLHSTWHDSATDRRNPGADGYGYPIDRYDSIHLIETTNTAGETCYVYNAKYDDTVYNYNDGQIFNTQLEAYTAAPYGTSGLYIGGILLPRDRFDPLGVGAAGVELGYGLSGNTYGNMVNKSPTWGEYYDETNYNLSLEGHAQFVYHKDANQYFIFTGDDDVYLYINGVRVLDIGGGHSISKVGINLNDVAEVCDLRDGETYRFDFFYLERHGTAANFGIETNIQIADPSMTTTKTGYQNGAPTGYNGYVDPNTKVGYSFTLRNDGDMPITNLTFDDPTIGIYFGHDKVTMNSDSTYSEMYMYLFNPDGSVNNSWGTLSPSGTALTDDVIKSVLATGLKAGETIGIYGFKYLIPANKWEDTDKDNQGDTFPNTVYTTSTTVHSGRTVTLSGTADWKVQKADVVFEPFHVYDWVHKDAKKNTVNNWTSPNGVTLTQTELMKYVTEYAAANNLTVNTSNLTTVLCTPSGEEDAYHANPNAKVEGTSIVYHGSQPGMDTVFYKIKGTGLLDGKMDDVVFNYDVYVYGAADNIYVLDYGLKVKLNEDEFSFKANDKLTVPENKYNAASTITGLNNNTGVYGDFMVEDTTKENGYKVMNGDTFATGDGDKSIEYWPRNIMNGTDSFRVEIQVREPGADTTKDMKYWGVDMYETVTTAPANVVYYEEDFPGLVYAKDIGYGWVHYETIDPDTNQPISGDYQSADQDSEYGSDPNYDKDKGAYLPTESEETTGETEGQNGNTDPNFINPGENSSTVQNLLLDTGNLSTLQKTALKAMERFLGVGGTDSNGSIYELDVKDTGEVMYFEFVGTGFEIISRTADDQYAILAVQVQANNDNDDTYETVVRHKPVITESRGGDQYQVPIISITGLERKQYRVVITAAGEYEAADGTVTKRMLYIDGIRIYNPLAPNEQLEYYNPNEAQAEFLEVKQLIKDGQAAYFGLESEDENGKFFLVSGTSYAENFSGEGVLTEIDNINEYLQNGPNNELYLEANERLGNMAAFYLAPKDGFTEEQRTIQIGAHRKITSESNVRNSVVMTYGSTRDDIVNAEDGDANYKSISTGTEMYYTIDPALLQTDEAGRYLVMIGTNGSDEEETLVLTNLKVSGYTVEPMEATLKESYREGTQEENSFLVELIDMYLAVITMNRDVARLITEGNAALIGYDETLKEPYLYSRRSYITDLNGEGKREVIENQDEYLADQGRVGDFGELKLTVSDNFTDMVAFYVKPNTNVPESARYIQLGAQATEIGGTAVVAYGNSSADFDPESYTETVGDEETLFEITVDESWDDGTGRYLVIITAGADENGQRQPFALTSLELCGYTIEPANETEKSLEMEIRDAVSAEGELDLAIITEALDVWATLFAAPETTAEEEETVTPASDEEDEALLPEEEEEAVTEETEAEEAEETEPEETEAVETEPEEAVDEIAE